jgi:hypothetical protein
MNAPSDVTSPVREEVSPLASDRIWQEGIVAGLIGAAVIALWFLILDTARGRPLYTPSILGHALFRREVLASGGAVPISFEMVVVYTWVHAMAFCLIGGLASRLLALAEDRPNLGFGIVLLFVVFEFGFVGVAMVAAEPVLQALTWPAILVGNVLAATAMAAYLWRQHPDLVIRP